MNVTARQLEILVKADESGGVIPADVNGRVLQNLLDKGLVEVSQKGIRLTDDGQQLVNRRKLSIAKRQKQETTFLSLWQQYGDPALLMYHDEDGQREHVKIIPGSSKRHDFVFPEVRVAVEVQGGTWTKGGHSTGAGIRRDAEKNTLALMAGWVTVFITTDMLQDQSDGFERGEKCIAQLKSVIARRREESILAGCQYVQLSRQTIRLLRNHDNVAMVIMTVDCNNPHFAPLTKHVLSFWHWDNQLSSPPGETPVYLGYSRPPLGVINSSWSANLHQYQKKIGALPNG